MADNINAKQIGELGLILFDGEGYNFVRESEWQKLTPSEKPTAPAGTVVSVSTDGETLFINLDLIGKAPTDNT